MGSKTNINPFNRVLSVAENYEKLERYYENIQLYDDLSYYAYQNSYYLEKMKGLRNPVHRSVEFFASKILPDPISITANSDAVKTSIEQFYKWSNFDAKKIVYSRNLALLGDLLIKVIGGDGKVYMESIHPKYMTTFKTDNRGYLTEIRLDIPQIDDNSRSYTFVEYWNKIDNYWANWNTYNGANQALDSLGSPDNFGFISSLGIDFLPFVFIKFSDTGAEHGHSCVSHAIDKICEADRQATRLHELIFLNNKNLWIVNSNKVDAKTGKFQAAPLVNGTANPEFKDNEILYMPGLTDIKTLVPDLKYADALAILQDMMKEIASDLPEIKYFDLPDTTSGKAIRLMLGSAIDRANEARSNMLAGLTRIDQMALTIGKNLGIFNGIGFYEIGDFEHTISCGEMFPLDLDEIATTLKNFGVALPMDIAMRKLGFSEEEIILALASKEKSDALSQQNFMTGFNQA